MERDEWGGKLEFIMTCISAAVGLGNVWRFPYLVHKNGGGAFIIPFITMLVLIGLPLYYLELAMGQFAGQGPITIWRISPMFKGLGYAMLILTSYIAIYYNVVICHCMHYFASSFTLVLPWSTCNNWWNDDRYCVPSNETSSSERVRNLGNLSVSSTQEYYLKYVLGMSSGIDDFGTVQWQLAISLAVCWMIVGAALIKGVQSLGKVSYFTAIFPYIMLTAIFTNACTKPGSMNGLKYYLSPQWSRLLDYNVWVDAAAQIFYSLNICTGGLITMASYNKFGNNCQRDAVFIAILNILTSIFAGAGVFANLGYMAYKKNIANIGEAVKGGPSLAFLVYPEAVTFMPFSPLWAVLFFVMMLALGMGSEFSLVETIISAFTDELRKNNLMMSRWSLNLFRVSICIGGFLLGLPMICNGGMYLLTIVDWAVSAYPLLLLAFLEIMIIVHIYSLKQFSNDLELMLGSRPNLYWRFTWYVTVPLICFGLLVVSFCNFSFPKLDKYHYPSSGIILGVLISLFPIVVVIGIIVYRFCRDGGWILFKELSKPKLQWGPTDIEARTKFLDRLSNIYRENATESGHQSQLELNGSKLKPNFFQSKLSIAEAFARSASTHNLQNTDTTSCYTKSQTDLTANIINSEMSLPQIVISSSNIYMK